MQVRQLGTHHVPRLDQLPAERLAVAGGAFDDLAEAVLQPVKDADLDSVRPEIDEAIAALFAGNENERRVLVRTFEARCEQLCFDPQIQGKG